ncbi:hypothetical protein JRO89_XS06G0244500 [Xanthoceras sorbifolium]|uniref:Peptidase M28 domain-containing protein n=1 Tax=Xanthoceras sorbifolium TaxID=99658 RepID=A0ABQ8HZ99_9ROSI|nr:hypothetical protein JRO89_XS06G0244500 [Xanthoceras sorbifolium]
MKQTSPKSKINFYWMKCYETPTLKEFSSCTMHDGRCTLLHTRPPPLDSTEIPVALAALRLRDRFREISFSLDAAASSSHGHCVFHETTYERRDDLFPEILRDEAVTRLNELGKVSDADGYLERTFMSPASVKAARLIREWMEDAGLRTWVDLMGNVHGRVDGMNASAEALLIGSHSDTVVDAGIFDGSLGIISAISALKALKSAGKLGKLKRPVEVIAFSDEEGVRFQSTFLGSAAVAGVLPATTLQISDKSRVTVQDALIENDIDIAEENLLQVKYDPASVWGYVEVHIEQGPVLEWVGFPLGVVKGIAGQTRLKVTVRGSQGHAGTVPMSMRQDPMAASAELIVLLESLCKRPKDYLSVDGHCDGSTLESLSNSLVCTVGEISTWPSASNVIPGQARYSHDIKYMEILLRDVRIQELKTNPHQISDPPLVCGIVQYKKGAAWKKKQTHVNTQCNWTLKIHDAFLLHMFHADSSGLKTSSNNDFSKINIVKKLKRDANSMPVRRSCADQKVVFLLSHSRVLCFERTLLFLFLIGSFISHMEEGCLAFIIINAFLLGVTLSH